MQENMERKVTPTRIKVKTVDSTSIYNSDAILNMNDNVQPTKLITLSWENINVHTPSSKDGLMGKLLFCKKEVPSKHIIKDVSGIAKPGSLMAIMGASGAGKTTLLNVLNYRNRGNLKISGDVKINGRAIQSRIALSAISGYVQQEDLFIGTLKVKEQLKFQAMLRMERSASKEEKLKRVEEVMNDLNLKKCENTLIGSPEKNIKGISGGERRRLAFACELITNPNLLFCDEPTSGLDSFMAMTVVDCMKALAAQGKTIVCTIHQPSSEVFEKFDTLCLLAEGRLAYIGDLLEAEKYFENIKYPVPHNFNPADHYIRSLAIVPNKREECLAIVESVCNSFTKSSQQSQLNADIKAANTMATNPAMQINLKTKISYKANFLVQFGWLLWRNFLATLRDPFSTQIAVIQTIVIAILFGLIYLQLKYDQTGVQNMNGIMFLFLTNMSFSNMFAVLNSFPAEIPIFLREHQNGMYMVASYYLSKIFIDLPKFIILPFLFISINYWMSNLNPDVGRFFICVAIIILVANTAVAFGNFISAAAPSANAALGLSGPILVPLMIFSGFFLNNATVPDYFIWLRYLSWFNYANELLIINQWDSIQNITCSTSICTYKTGNDVISFLQMKKENYAIDWIAICTLLVGWRLITFLILLIKSYKR